MWLLFHHNAKTRTVRDGQSFVETCPDCGERATFVEVEITENYGVFFVDLIGDTERGYKCGACGKVFDLKDQAPATSVAAPLPPARPRPTAADIQAQATRIDDELAELKKRMGR